MPNIVSLYENFNIYKQELPLQLKSGLKKPLSLSIMPNGYKPKKEFIYD